MNSLSPSCFHQSFFNLFAIIQKRPLELQLRLYLFILISIQPINEFIEQIKQIIIQLKYIVWLAIKKLR